MVNKKKNIIMKYQGIVRISLLVTLLVGCQVADAADNSSLVFIKNEFLRVGVHLKWGGAITHISQPGGENLINSYDLGRQIQQSYYSGPANYQREGKEKSPNWARFPWNPIQTGDAFDNGSRVVEHQVKDAQLYIKTVPMLWPMNNDAAECFMETWITLSPDSPAFSYRARLTNARNDKKQYHAHHQEVPAVYVNGPWHRLMTYKGDKPFTNGAVVELRNDHKESWPWINVLATEGWAALVNDKGTGIGVCVSKAMEFHGGFAGKRGKGGEKSSHTGYMSPMTREILDHNIVYDYNCTFVLGSLDHIRREADRLASKKLPEWDFKDARHGWYYQNGHDEGWPLSGGLVVKANNVAKPVRVIGPLTFWRAEAAQKLALQISSKTDGTMTIFWRGMPHDAASTKPSQWNKWTQQWWDEKRSRSTGIPSGDKKWVTIDLSGHPSYSGGLTGLAIDLPSDVIIHNVRLIAE
jgi:hypothetical protein